MKDDDTLNENAWDAFCESLKSLKVHITDPTIPCDSADRAEGYRYLTRLLRNGLENIVENSSPAFPNIQKLGHMVKMGADNPDNIYMNARVDPQYEYRLSGRRGTVHYLAFSAISGSYGSDGTMITDGFLDSDALEVNPDGSFEIRVSSTSKPGNWLAIKPQTNSLLIRQTFQNRQTEQEATLRIERLNVTDTPAPYTPKRLRQDLQAVADYLQGTVKLFADWSKSFVPLKNTLPPADQAYCQSIGADPNIYYYHSYWEIAEDEVLEIRAPRIPLCTSWNFQLDNYWMESLDYRYHRITVNNSSAVVEADGSVLLCIAERDPGYGNWIDTAGHRRGTMCWRWTGATEHPLLATRLIPRP